jgi:hypothetical protein
MATIQAESTGAPLAHWLQRGETSRVTARFDATLQLQSELGQMWALTVHPNPGPFRMVLPSMPAYQVCERIQVRDGELVGKGVAVRWDAVSLWDPRPKRHWLSVAERRSAARRLTALIGAENLPEAHGFWDLLADTWDTLGEALRHQDTVSLQTTMARLIGCGPGLTPTGDDVTQALLVTLFSGDDSDCAAFGVLARAVTSLLPRTTRASRVFLQEALRGWAFGPLKTLLEALPDAPPAAVQALWRVGASSGPAYAFGVLLGIAWRFSLN